LLNSVISQAYPTLLLLRNSLLELSGTATFTGGRSGTVSLAIIKVGGDWKVDAFNLTPQ
jgi:hypothetical protein